MKFYSITGDEGTFLLAFASDLNNTAFIRSKVFDENRKIVDVFDELEEGNFDLPAFEDVLGMGPKELTESTAAADVYTANIVFQGREILLTATALTMDLDPKETLVLEIEGGMYDPKCSISRGEKSTEESIFSSLVDFCFDEIADTVPRNFPLDKAEIERRIRETFAKV